MRLRPVIATLGMAGLMLAPAATPASASAAAPVAAVARPAAAAPSEQDAAFLIALRQVNYAEIAAGQIAWRKTTNPAVKDVAAGFLRDHIHLDAALYQTARLLRVYLPETPNAAQQALATRYQRATPAKFDALYLRKQLAGLPAVLDLIERQITLGTDPDVTVLAIQAKAVVESHRALLEAATGA
jgi:putative membrane protein